jgi:hypothetical protein
MALIALSHVHPPIVADALAVSAAGPGNRPA